MRNFRGTLVFALVVAALAAFAIYDYKRAEKAEEKKQQDAAVVHVKPAEVSKLEIVSKKGTIVLEKTGDEWKLTAPVQDTADQEAVVSLLSSLESERARETVIEGADVNLATYGLDQPLARFKVTSKDGRIEEVKVGSVKAYDGSLYGQIGEEKKVLLLGLSWDALTNKTAKDFRDKRLVRAAPGEVGLIEIAQGKAAPLRLEKSEGHWRVQGAGKDAYPLSDELVEEYLGEVKNLRADDVLEDDKDASGSRKKHGLDKPIIKVRIAKDKADQGLSIAIGISQSGGESLPAESSDAKAIYALGRVSAELLGKKAEDFYDKKLPFQFSADEVKRVKIESPELKAELVKQGDIWALADKGLQKTVDSAKLNDLIGRIAKLDAVRFLEAVPNGKPTRKIETSIRLMKDSGDPVFEMFVSGPVTEKLKGEEAELTYRPVWTNKVARVVGVPDAVVKNLGLGSIVSDNVLGAARPNPTASPAANGAAK